MIASADDRATLADLVHRYAATIDDRQFDLATSLFTADAELILPDPPAILVPVRRHQGRPAISRAVAAVAATARTQHAIVGEIYDAGVDADSARGRIACIAHHWASHEDQFRDVTWHLRYDDEYHRAGAQWRIRRRALTIDAIEIRPVRQVRAPGQASDQP
jgi:3-phenylpropionate/cinnamic acid dioxygenase small subunit